MFGKDGAFAPILKGFLEEALQAEMDEALQTINEDSLKIKDITRPWTVEGAATDGDLSELDAKLRTAVDDFDYRTGGGAGHWTCGQRSAAGDAGRARSYAGAGTGPSAGPASRRSG